MRAHVEANEDPDTRFLSRCDSYFVHLFSNRGLDVHHLFASWVPFFVAERAEVVLALDWTDYDADDQSTFVLSVVTSHGRSTPLLWKMVRKSQLKKRRNAIEDALLLRLRQVIPESVRVTMDYFAAMATCPEERSARLLARFAFHLSLQPFCSQVFAIV